MQTKHQNQKSSINRSNDHWITLCGVNITNVNLTSDVLDRSYKEEQSIITKNKENKK